MLNFFYIYFSGFSKTVPKMMSLKNLCYEVLTERIDKLVDIKPKDYCLVKPILQKLNSTQLKQIEKLSPKLMPETDDLWLELCRNEFNFKGSQSDHNYYDKSLSIKSSAETWRQYYWRLISDRKRKLDEITINIRAKNDLIESKKRLAIVCETKEVNRKSQKKSKLAPLMKKCLLMRKNTVIKS